MGTMSISTKDTDTPFLGAGTKAGLEIWCSENLQLVPVPKSSQGKFFSGSAYLVLHTAFLKDGTAQHDIHYWIGNHATEVDSAMASDKALELDMTLGSCTVQYKEIQGQETEKFLSYFKPCVIPVEGVFSSRTEQSDCATYKVSLLACKGDHAVSVKEVPFSRSSLNHTDVFILDTASKIFLFCGYKSSIQERAKALEVVQFIKEEKHNANCEVATIEDGKFVGDSDAGVFWSYFGGYAPIPKDSPSFFQRQHDVPSVRLFWITMQGKLSLCATELLNREMLTRDKCYMLDCGVEAFVWMGRSTCITERKTSISATEDFLRSEGRSTGSYLTVLTDGSETPKFRSYFYGWPQMEKPKLYEEGRGKVAAIFKQRGYDVKELPEEGFQPYIDCSGTVKVWRVDGDKLHVVLVEKEIRMFSSDCYIVQYAYPGMERDENILYTWLGHDSSPEYRVDAIAHMINVANSTKGVPVLAQIIEGKEPDQFFWIMQRLVVAKGGMSTMYKNFIAEKGITDETYDGNKTALFRIQGTCPLNMQAIQVNQVSSSLNSSYCYILQTLATIFTWIGNFTSSRDHDLLDRMLELINPTGQPISLREGGEPDEFWLALGGKAEYPREKEIRKHLEDPHLFVCHSSEGDFKGKEIFNFTQDDLTTEDAFILDCHEEIYVWIGCHSDVQSKQQALKLGLKYLEADILAQRLSLETPVYVVTERHEPQFFTRFFVWDSSKSNMYGNSFERKLALLRGKTDKLEAPTRNSWRTYSPELKSNGSRRASISSNGTARSVSPASSASGSQFSSQNIRRLSSPIPFIKPMLSGSSPYHSGSGFSTTDPSHAGGTNCSQIGGDDDDDDDASSLIYPYERVKAASSDPVKGIDITKRETYLSKEEFREKFGMTRKEFYQLPKWRQNKLKISHNLF
ncbi:actin filament capping [Ancistrocladus abbreviatus]